MDALARAATPMELLRILVTGAVCKDKVPAPVLRVLPESVAHDFRGIERADAVKRGRAVGTRAWDKVVGITWHQTASGALDESHPKLLAIPAHILLHRSGRWSLLHPLTAYVQHGHALNGGTIGIEVDARAAGIDGDRRTFWRSKDETNGYTDKRGRKHPPKGYDELVAEATAEQLAAIPHVMRWCCGEVAANGGRVRANWAHRQGRDDRTTDPGSRIWNAVEAAELNLRGEHELVDVRNRRLGSGTPVPREWRVVA